MTGIQSRDFPRNRRTPQKVHYPYCEGMVCKMCADKGTEAKITNMLSDSEKDKRCSGFHVPVDCGFHCSSLEE